MDVILIIIAVITPFVPSQAIGKTLFITSPDLAVTNLGVTITYATIEIIITGNGSTYRFCSLYAIVPANNIPIISKVALYAGERKLSHSGPKYLCHKTGYPLIGKSVINKNTDAIIVRGIITIKPDFNALIYLRDANFDTTGNHFFFNKIRYKIHLKFLLAIT